MDLSKLYDADSGKSDEDSKPRSKPRPKRKSSKPKARSIYEAAVSDSAPVAAPKPRAPRPKSKPKPQSKPRSRRAPRQAEEENTRPRKRSQRRKAGAADDAKRESQRLAEAKKTTVPEDGDFGSEFKRFKISAPILKAIDDMGWSAPSEIQEKVIPLALEGRDVVGQARTGTGKTGAFALPLLELFRERGENGEKGRPPACLILSPTRELALQIFRQMEQLGAYTQVRCVAVYGGAPMEPQLRALRQGVDIVIGTPGRVMDHMRRNTLRTEALTCFVLDEADRMFDLGFREDIYWISRLLPENDRQTLLLSATMPKEIVILAKQVTENPELIYTAMEKPTVKNCEQFYVSVDSPRKLELLVRLLGDENPAKGMVFTRTKRAADKIAEKLRRRGLDAGEIHGDLRQRRREAILGKFREGNLAVLVATDVAARGLDIQGVTHVVNYDIPEDPEDYVHRIGRTARMGQSGRAFTFVTPADGKWLMQIEKLINLQVPHYDVEGFRLKATDEEKSQEQGRRPASTHPMASKLSPALLNILANRKAPPRGGGRGGPRGGGKGGRGGGRGGPRGGGKGGRGGGRR